MKSLRQFLKQWLFKSTIAKIHYIIDFDEKALKYVESKLKPDERYVLTSDYDKIYRMKQILEWVLE